MKEKDVVKADFSVLIIMHFKRLLKVGGILRIHSDDSLPMNRGSHIL
jgi:hypothetical protein